MGAVAARGFVAVVFLVVGFAAVPGIVDLGPVVAVGFIVVVGALTVSATLGSCISFLSSFAFS